MKKWAIGCAVMSLVMVAFTGASANNADLTNKEIMQKGHGKGGFLAQAKAAVPAKGEAKFDDLAKASKELVALADNLAKNKPTKGEDASWKTQTGIYVDNVKALDDAAGKKDAKAAQAALTKLGTSCGACHSKHK